MTGFEEATALGASLDCPVLVLSTAGCSTKQEFVTRVALSLPQEQGVRDNLDALDETLSTGLQQLDVPDVVIWWADGESASRTDNGAAILRILQGVTPGLEAMPFPPKTPVQVHVLLGEKR